MHLRAPASTSADPCPSGSTCPQLLGLMPPKDGKNADVLIYKYHRFHFQKLQVWISEVRSQAVIYPGGVGLTRRGHEGGFPGTFSLDLGWLHTCVQCVSIHGATLLRTKHSTDLDRLCNGKLGLLCMLPFALWNRSHSDSTFSSAEPRLWNQSRSEPSTSQHQVLPSSGLYALPAVALLFSVVSGPAETLLSFPRPESCHLPSFLYPGCSTSGALLSSLGPSREQSHGLEHPSPRWAPITCCWVCCLPKLPLVLRVWFICP